MIKLTKALNAWKVTDFKKSLKGEIEQMDAGQLPLQQGLSLGSFASDDNVTVIILSVSDNAEVIHAKAGLFYTSLVPGCNCADDPTPDEKYNEYCEVLFEINKITAETEIALIKG